MASSKKSRTTNAHSKEWVVSCSTREDLEEMVMDMILLDEATAGWRSAEGERFLNPHASELVVFDDFYRQGFGQPAHPFVHKLLAYYGIAFIHLNPNSILHLSIYQSV
jgi:hypothetical protein